jgi:hypothetical protein
MLTESKLAKNVVYASTIIGAIITITGAFAWIYNEYQDHKSVRELELDSRIDNRLKDHGNEILLEIDNKIELFHGVVDTLQEQIDNITEGNEMFAVGYRGDGSGKLWYRDEYGKVFRVYTNSTTGQYYYINETGLAVYLN